ncbi:phosphatase PAP2 family protein [Mycobacterium lentiflavum]|uniref:phosphatase PAP2 family protein n=1 Tax=Mycobacterium lentiflavum TaxID=141349 RepID=UPI0033135F30
MGDWSISTPNRDTANICERHFGHNKGAAPEPGYHASGFSFLSGHSTDAAVAAGIVRWLVAARLGRRGAGRPLLFALVIGYAAAVGASRVYLGIHWPTDVFGGWAFAVAWLACTVWVMSSAGGRPRGRQADRRRTAGVIPALTSTPLSLDSHRPPPASAPLCQPELRHLPPDN